MPTPDPKTIFCRYDQAGRRPRLLYGISSFAYQVDKTGNRTRLTLANGDYVDYLYDDTHQLTREHRKDSGGATLYWNAFYYGDAAGNRTRLGVPGVPGFRGHSTQL